MKQMYIHHITELENRFGASSSNAINHTLRCLAFVQNSFENTILYGCTTLRVQPQEKHTRDKTL